MPYVPKFTPSELATILQAMHEYPPEKVELDYRNKEISLKDKLTRLQLYGQGLREAQIANEVQVFAAKDKVIRGLGGGMMGELKYFYQGVAKEYKAAWDNAQEGKPAEAVFRTMMGSLKLLSLYNVPGDIIERWSLEFFPNSPGFARAANWAAWGYANFYGLGAVLKAPFEVAGAAARGTVKGVKAAGEFATYLKDPVAAVVKAAKTQDALVATQVAKATAENTARKGAGAVGAAVEAEKAGTQAFKTAAPADVAAVGTAAEVKFPTPQELEQLTTVELIKHYEERAVGMVRSKSAGGPGVSQAETQAAAAAKPISFEEIAKRTPDQPISATEMEAMANVHKEVLTGFNSVLDEASKHIGEIRSHLRPDLVQALKSHLAAVEVTNPAFLSGSGQAGRGLAHMRSLQDLVGESKVADTLIRSLSSEKLLDSSDEAVAYLTQKLYLLGKSERAKLVDVAASEAYQTPTIRLFYKSLLFARPGIHVANILGNTGSILLHGVNKSASSLMPWSEPTWREASAYWTGIWDSRARFGEIWASARKTQNENLGKAGIEGTAAGTMVSKGPLGWLGFEDELMAGIVESGLAKSKAITEGLSKWDELQQAIKAGAFTPPERLNKNQWIDDFVSSSLNDPVNYERLLKETERESEYILFHSPMSQWGEKIAQGIRMGPIDYIAPVLKFPISAMKMGADWTPGLQMLTHKFFRQVTEGGAAADMARARMTLSWMISSQVYEMAKAGIITGDGPANREANAIWRSAGNNPRSIFGVPFTWAEPFATWFSFVADLAHNSGEMDEENLSNAFQAVVTSGMQAVENNYFLRIMEGVTNSVTDIMNRRNSMDIVGGVVKLIGQPLKTLLTGGTVGRGIGEAINPERPDMRFYGELGDLKNWLFAGTPFGSDTRPRLNFSGKVEMVAPMVGSDWIRDNIGVPDWFARGLTAIFQPSMRQSRGEDDPVAQFLNEFELKIHDNWKYYGRGSDPDSPLPSAVNETNPRVNLTGDQAFSWKYITMNKVKEYGTNRTWPEAIEALRTDPDFLSSTQSEKQQEINRLYGEFRADGLEALKASDPSLAAKEEQMSSYSGTPGAIATDLGIAKEAQSVPLSDDIQGNKLREPLRLDITKSIAELNATPQ